MFPKVKLNEVTPILISSAIFIFSTWATVHTFFIPRSEADTRDASINKRIDEIENVQNRIFSDIHEIREFIFTKVEHK